MSTPRSFTPMLDTQPVTPNLGALIRGVDLSQVDDATLSAIEQALVEHKVIFFEDQQWSAAQQRAFAERFGELHVHPVFDNDPDEKELVIFAYDDVRKGNNDTWHTDVTFIETPVKMGILYALEIPPVGGDTLWLDTEAAYAALSRPMQQLLEGLTAQHSFFNNLAPDRLHHYLHDELYRAALLKMPPVSHPVVRTHPVSGRKSLYVNRAFTNRIEQLTALESEFVLRGLLRHLETPEFQMRWRWKKNTVAIWDNRSTQHLAVSDYFPARRAVRRAAVVGDKPF